MSAAGAYLAGNPVALLVFLAVCGTSAWQATLLLGARRDAKTARGSYVFDEARRAIGADRGRHARADAAEAPPRKEARLADAGLDVSPSAWNILRGGSAALLFALGCAAGAPAAGLALACCAVAGAGLWLSSRRKHMEVQLERQVNQLEMQMAENSRAGLSVERSLRTCLEHADQPLKTHLERIVGELTYSNRTLSEAFAGFAERTSSPDVRMLSNVISVQQETGANLADTLDFLAETIAEKQRMRLTLRSRIAEMSLTKAMVALAPLVILAICCLFIEGVADFYASNPLGWILLGGCAAGDAFGVALLNKMSDIPVD